MICPKCSTYSESNFCPNCGQHLSKPTNTNCCTKYEAYKKYYPDKWAAISALRQDTGLGFSEANQIINTLFGTTDDDERTKADAEHEKIYQAQEQQKAARKAIARKTAKAAGAVAGVGLYAAVKTIFSLSKKYK